jgi:hypothetical protein
MIDAFLRISLSFAAAALFFGGCAPSTGIRDVGGPLAGSQPRFMPVAAATVRALNLSPSSVTGGQTASGTIVLTAAAPVGGIVIDLSVDDPAVNVPTTVKVAGGATSAVFIVNTSPVTVATTAMITGTHDGVRKIVGLAVRAPVLSSISLNPTAVTGNSASTATVRLNGKSPAGGIVVTLSSNMPSRAVVPPTIAVAPGTDTATFTVNTTAGEQAAATISASSDSVTKTATLTIQRKKPQVATTSDFKRAATGARDKARGTQTY